VAAGQMSLIKQYSHELSIVLIALFGIGVLYIAIKQLIKYKRARN